MARSDSTSDSAAVRVAVCGHPAALSVSAGKEQFAGVGFPQSQILKKVAGKDRLAVRAERHRHDRRLHSIAKSGAKFARRSVPNSCRAVIGAGKQCSHVGPVGLFARRDERHCIDGASCVRVARMRRCRHSKGPLPSCEPVSNILPFGLNAAAATTASCIGEKRSEPIAASHSRTVLSRALMSSEPVSSIFPSGIREQW